MPALINCDVLVYGGGFPAVAAARQAQDMLGRGARVLLVTADSILGGTGTVGGQNFWDVRPWPKDGALPQGGSFARWYGALGQGYDPEEMARLLRRELQREPSVEVLLGHEIAEAVGEDLVVRPVRDGDRGRQWTEGPDVAVTARVEVDASETGRLVRLRGVAHTVGREDWAGDRRQMAASLMFPVTGVDTEAALAARGPDGPEFSGLVDPVRGRLLLWGGHATARHDPQVVAFHHAHPGFRLKGLNAAPDNEGRYWLNVLLAYGVDARLDGLDAIGTQPTPDPEPGTLRLDEAWVAMRALMRSGELLQALRRFPGFAGIDFTMRGDAPESARGLYIRESIHALRHEAGAESARFALTLEDVRSGGDRHAAHAVGYGYYWLDNNGYEPIPSGDSHPGPQAVPEVERPFTLPYELVTVPSHPRLLVPGYAASCSSRAWWALRVLPNLSVLGDAAGVAAALGVLRGRPPGAFIGPEIREVQRQLQAVVGAKLDRDARRL